MHHQWMFIWTFPSDMSIGGGVGRDPASGGPWEWQILLMADRNLIMCCLAWWPSSWLVTWECWFHGGRCCIRILSMTWECPSMECCLLLIMWIQCTGLTSTSFVRFDRLALQFVITAVLYSAPVRRPCSGMAVLRRQLQIVVIIINIIIYSGALPAQPRSNNVVLRPERNRAEWATGVRRSAITLYRSFVLNLLLLIEDVIQFSIALLDLACFSLPHHLKESCLRWFMSSEVTGCLFNCLWSSSGPLLLCIMSLPCTLMCWTIFLEQSLPADIQFSLSNSVEITFPIYVNLGPTCSNFLYCRVLIASEGFLKCTKSYESLKTCMHTLVCHTHTVGQCYWPTSMHSNWVKVQNYTCNIMNDIVWMFFCMMWIIVFY